MTPLVKKEGKEKIDSLNQPQINFINSVETKDQQNMRQLLLIQVHCDQNNVF